MRKFLNGIIFGAVFGYALVTPAGAMQAITTISLAQAATCSIEFDQDASNLVAAQQFRYDAVIDGSGSGSTIPVTCTGTTSPFQCVTPLPNKNLGTHSVVITASEILSDNTVLSSSPSTSFTYRIANAPNAPKNLHIKKP